MSTEPLPIEMCLRAWEVPPERPVLENANDRVPPERPPWRFESLKLLITLDDETSTEATCALPGFDSEVWGRGAQRLLFGRMHVYRVEHSDGEARIAPVGEFPFHADDLPESGMLALKTAFAAHGQPRYGNKRVVDSPGWLVTRDGEVQPISTTAYAHLISRTQMVDYLFKCVHQWQERCLVLGYNLPFDLSRIAIDWRYTAPQVDDFYRGGFSFGVVRRPDGRVSGQHPRIEIKALQKGAAMRWTRYKQGRRGQVPTRYRSVSNFLDVATLLYALTAHTHSLKKACELYQNVYCKTDVGDEGHGVISPEYVAYNRDDVLATTELAVRLLREYAHMGLSTPPTRVYSPASLTKAMLRDMRVLPRAQAERDFPQEWHGAAMESFVGGRTECRLRACPVPVLQLDFFSMYTTVRALMGLWDFVIAERIVQEDATTETRAWLASVTAGEFFRPETWRQLTVLCLVEADGGRLPVRSPFRDDGAETIGVLPDYSTAPRWVTLADVVYAKIVGGHAPRILRAMRFRAEGMQPHLRPITVSGIEIDPRRENPFVRLIEERALVKQKHPPHPRYAHLSQDERDARATGLKTMPNAEWGITVEMNPAAPPNPGSKPRPKRVTVYTGTERHTAVTFKPERPGSFCFPLIGTFTTASARLMLGLLEREIAVRGGAYTAMDTDSAFVIATPNGGPITLDAADAAGKPIAQVIHALSHDAVREIVAKFESLNPYDRDAVPSSILKIEDINYDGSGQLRELLFYGLAAKSYALFTRDATGRLRCTEKFSEFGLGAYRDPYHDPKHPERNDPGRWKREFWEALANDDPLHRLPFADSLALRQTVLSTPHVANLFGAMPWIAPFSFGLCATPANNRIIARAEDIDGSVILPFETDPATWRRLPALHRKSGEPLGRICSPTEAPADIWDAMDRDTGSLPVRTFDDVLRAYALRFNRIWLGPDGEPCTSLSRGYLTHRPVVEVRRRYIGKESEGWELRDDGLLDLDDTQTVYEVGTRRGGIVRDYREALQGLRTVADRKAIAAEVTAIGGRAITSRTWEHWLVGTRIPDREMQQAIVQAASAYAKREMRKRGVRAPETTLALCHMYLQQVRREGREALAAVTRAMVVEVRAAALAGDSLHAGRGRPQTPDQRGAVVLAERLGISTTTLRRWIREGKPLTPACAARVRSVLASE
jgi:hypothetical protein